MAAKHQKFLCVDVQGLDVVVGAGETEVWLVRAPQRVQVAVAKPKGVEAGFLVAVSDRDNQKNRRDYIP